MDKTSDFVPVASQIGTVRTVETCGKLCFLCRNTSCLIKMALSAAQKNLLLSTWKDLATDHKTTIDSGTVLFKILLETFPDNKKFFAHINKPEDLASSGVGRAHATAVFTGIGAFMDCMEDKDCLEGLAIKLSRNHIDRNIGPDRFNEARQVFPSFLEARLGGKATADVKAAWDALLGWLVEHVAAEQKRR